MLFGSTKTFGVECEITDTSYPCFLGKVRMWLGGHAFGDFSGEIISTYVLHFDRILVDSERPSLDCTGTLPYMGTLRWKIVRLDAGHRIEAESQETGTFDVHLREDELRDVIISFTDWVRSHPGFVLA